MKKQLLISGLFLLTIIATKGLFAQSANIPVDEDTKLITYKEVIQQPGDADKLYLTAISWVNSFYNNPNEVTTTRDRENGKLVLDHRFKIFNIDKWVDFWFDIFNKKCKIYLKNSKRIIDEVINKYKHLEEYSTYPNDSSLIIDYNKFIKK